MAPPKISRGIMAMPIKPINPASRKGISTRSQILTEQCQNVERITRAKRKAENSPQNEKVKRSALCNVTNALPNDGGHNKNVAKKKDSTEFNILNLKTDIASKEDAKQKENTFLFPMMGVDTKTRNTKIMTRAAARCAKAGPTNINNPVAQQNEIHIDSKPNTRRISNEFDKTEESLYMSALEEITTSSDSLRLSDYFESRRRSSLQNSKTQNKANSKSKNEGEVSDSTIYQDVTETEMNENTLLETSTIVFPDGVADYDESVSTDIAQVSEYAMDIFRYLKDREIVYQINDYMPNQVNLTEWMRALLVDWMVEVQETFELNHETLYLAVKVVDKYLSKKVVEKDKLQLLGAASIFVASKYDERSPPCIDDFLFICDGAYKHPEFIRMEMEVFKSVDYDLGIPLSYRFLRRYARCSQTPMTILTLARYILELSLMDYNTVCLKDSKLACAALFIARRMYGLPGWNSTLQFYTGYPLDEFVDIIPILNHALSRKPKAPIRTIRNKYSHKIFFEVARKPVLSIDKILSDTTFDISKETDKKN